MRPSSTVPRTLAETTPLTYINNQAASSRWVTTTRKASETACSRCPQMGSDLAKTRCHRDPLESTSRRSTTRVLCLVLILKALPAAAQTTAKSSSQTSLLRKLKLKKKNLTSTLSMRLHLDTQLLNAGREPKITRPVSVLVDKGTKPRTRFYSPRLIGPEPEWVSHPERSHRYRPKNLHSKMAMGDRPNTNPNVRLKTNPKMRISRKRTHTRSLSQPTTTLMRICKILSGPKKQP